MMRQSAGTMSPIFTRTMSPLQTRPPQLWSARFGSDYLRYHLVCLDCARLAIATFGICALSNDYGDGTSNSLEGRNGLLYKVSHGIAICRSDPTFSALYSLIVPTATFSTTSAAMTPPEM